MKDREKLLRLIEKGKAVEILDQKDVMDHLDRLQGSGLISIDRETIRLNRRVKSDQQLEDPKIQGRTERSRQSEMNGHHSIFLVLLLVSVLLFAFGLVLIG